VTLIDRPEPFCIVAARLSAAGLAVRYFRVDDGGYLVVQRAQDRRDAEMIIDGDGYTALHYRMDLGRDPARVAEAAIAVLDAIDRVEARSSHQHAESVARYDSSTTECAGDPGMPAPQDQVAGLEQPVRETARPDTRSARETDVPREGRAATDTLHERLERLPPNHPSSPFREDGSRKPPPPDLRNLGLALPDESPAPEGSADLAAAREDRATDQARAEPDAHEKPHVALDGSWDWKGCHLTPEQSRAGDQAAERCRSAEGRDVDGNYGEHGLTPAMRRIEAQLEHGRLVDGTEEFALKSPDRFKEKLANRISLQPDEPVEELASRIHDGVRYTFVYDNGSYSDGLWKTEETIQGQGYELLIRKPSWESEEYKGLNSQWRDSNTGVLFEVQFHTHESWEAKQRTHDAYELISDLRTPPEERQRLEAYQREVTANVSVPPGAQEIPPYRKEGE
jgi:hypothetical protein